MITEVDICLNYFQNLPRASRHELSTQPLTSHYDIALEEGVGNLYTDALSHRGGH